MDRYDTATHSKPPMPGQFIGIGGYRLHVDCQGRGDPAVILEAAGWGDFSLTWALVQPQVAEFTRVCAYDRAGYGWSDPSFRRSTSAAMAEELHALLQQAAIPGPYVLVGHSFSAILVRLFASKYRDEVAGMVLVDAAHQEQFQRFPAAVLESRPALFEMQVQLLEQMKTQWLAGSLDPLTLPVPPKLPEPIQELYRGVMSSSPAWIDAMIGEMEALDDSHAQMRAVEDKSLGDMPLIVLSHGEPQSAPGLSDEVNRAYEATWQQLQAELAALSSRGRRVVVAGAGDNIQHDRPDAVVDAIAEVVAAVREGRQSGARFAQ